jgi:hypothetical protein
MRDVPDLIAVLDAFTRGDFEPSWPTSRFRRDWRRWTARTTWPTMARRSEASLSKRADGDRPSIWWRPGQPIDGTWVGGAVSLIVIGIIVAVMILVGSWWDGLGADDREDCIASGGRVEEPIRPDAPVPWTCEYD